MIRRYQYQFFSDPVRFDLIPPPPVILNWYQPLSEPQQPEKIHPSGIPFQFYVFLPPNVLTGCPEVEISQFLNPRGVVRPNMPIAYIRQFYNWNAGPTLCSTALESPGSQTQNNP